MNKKSKVITAAAVMTSVLALTACGSSTTGNQGAPAGGGANKTADAKKSVEIFSWWTGGGEEEGLKALIQLFKKQNPDVNVINAAVAGGAGTNAQAVLASRMQAGDPPDTFQVHAGAELLDSWVKAGKMQPLNDLYKEAGWTDKFPKSLVDMMSKDGKIYSVAVDIHRGNVLWINKKIFDDNHLKPPTTFDEFFKDADILKAKGITPLALGDKEPWTATMLFEDVLLGELGPQGYDDLTQGKIKWDDPKVKQSLEIFKKMLTYVNSDHAARTWQDASQLVAKGQAAMNVMGDWAKGYFTSDLKLKPNVDFEWTTTPGTGSSFMVISDTFGLPKGIKHPEETKTFLKLLGSVEGQDAFNPLKGSIPARVDADPSKYDVYSKQAMADFKKDALTPSIAHGSAMPQGFVTQMNQAINIFVTQGDVNTAATTLEQDAEQNK
ncbi:ABC transporter substrate-binding protein [Fodinisporobacter ferrooxydans]|uniref:Probable sugar-binding periplasmic protein n=1 Tax=Fodinisporobacter ferrooxydans TaxID=2901836 RepID=A0ABY4CK95_9BACL|nr:ABC transporter substrate-binding protein [Alicyclobacillaceae bacterium MYW30-H2]